MISNDTFRNMAMAFAEVTEEPHFERASFRVKKKIFTTLSEKDAIAMVRLTLEDQSVFCAYDPMVIYPVPGGWGKQGATYINLKKVRKDMLQDALTTAYCFVAPEKLAKLYRP